MREGEEEKMREREKEGDREEAREEKEKDRKRGHTRAHVNPSLHFGEIPGFSSPREHPRSPLSLGIQEFLTQEFFEF